MQEPVDAEISEPIEGIDETASAPDEPAAVYIPEAPISLTMLMDGWRYGIEIEAIQGLTFSTTVENFPQGYAGLRIEYGGEPVASIASLDEGRNAPDIGVYQVVYEWEDAPQSEKETIPPLVEDDGALLGFDYEYFNGGSCSIYVAGEDVQCSMQNLDWQSGPRTPGFYALGSGLLGESGSETRSYQTQVEGLVEYLSQNVPDEVQIVLENEQGTNCFVNVALATGKATSGEYSDCTLIQE